jgi:two-component system sporulation sensor kinase A
MNRSYATSEQWTRNDVSDFLSVAYCVALGKDHNKDVALFILGTNSMVSNLPNKQQQAWPPDAQRALQAADARYRSLVETATDAIFYLDLEMTILLANRAAADLYGFPAATDMVGQPFWILVAPSNRAYLQGKVAAVDLEWRFSGDCQMIRQDGREFPAEVNASAVAGENGEPVAITLIAHDSTVRQRMEQYVRRTERLAAMGQMAAVLAHEIRNPLQAIQSSVELVVDYLVDPAEREEYLRHSFQEIERLTEITNRVLNFSDLESTTLYAITISDLLQRAVALVDRQLVLANIHLTRNVPADLPPVYVSPDQIVQVLVNVLTNAIEAMPEGGRIDVQAWVKDDFIHIAVTDSGPAIAPELLDRIFDPFFSTKVTGAGLGLTISDNIVQQHGGILAVQNQSDNQGVIVTMALPVAPFMPIKREASE